MPNPFLYLTAFAKFLFGSLYKFLFSNDTGTRAKESVFCYQWEKLFALWNNDSSIGSNAMGIERAIKLFLVIIQFAFPGFWWRFLFNLIGPRARTLGIELYVLFKLGSALYILHYQLFNNDSFGGTFFTYWIPYMIIESVLYTAALIFCEDIFPKPKSYKRNLILLLIDYSEITIDFASLYLMNKALFFSGKIPVLVTSSLDAAYFSFVTSVTVGYGDIAVMNSQGKILTICQILIFLLYGVLFLNFYASRIEEKVGLNPS
jgi:hypothetical protein